MTIHNDRQQNLASTMIYQKKKNYNNNFLQILYEKVAGLGLAVFTHQEFVKEQSV